MSAQLKINGRLAFKPSPTGYSDVLERSLPPALDDQEEHSIEVYVYLQGYMKQKNRVLGTVRDTDQELL